MNILEVWTFLDDETMPRRAGFFLWVLIVVSFSDFSKFEL